ncbi:17382_t:CDS:1 [Acaulospora morrowiae]|uniref:Phosphate transporter n=1 Tax=Acaulospora morrowiae TaxID=94023 RepID=A0A9N9DA55_9GLOM|nr:17382_t:CDS:1 [Acaulospora morrowiae]
MEIHEFTWLFVICLIAAFADAFGIGANDVANSFATSVGSRSLTLKQACVIAVFTEFLGAFLLGSHTAETIRSKILDVKLFAKEPELIMLAMTCALVGSASWVIFASSKGLPVSTTHSIVGAIIGVGIAAFGTDAIIWNYNGVAKIVTSWFISPAAAALVASIIYLITKYAVLLNANSFKRGLRTIPFYFSVTIAINVLYIVYKGSPALALENKGPEFIAPLTVGTAVFFALFSWLLYSVWLQRLIENKETGLRWYHIPVIRFIGPRFDKAAIEEGGNNGTDLKDNVTIENKEDETTAAEANSEEEGRNLTIVQKIWKKSIKFATRGVNKSVPDYKAHEHAQMHEEAVKYDENTEYLYSFLQVLTATFASFAHGSNDVANAIGPLSVTYGVWNSAKVDVSGKTPVPLWVLAYGGVAIDLGLILYGYHVMRSLGNRITYHSPSRGFSMELGAALTVVTASKLGLPISTTHCITGATVGVGLCNGSHKAINWPLVAWCVFSWILTLPVAGTIAGLLFAFAANSPKLV